MYVRLAMRYVYIRVRNSVRKAPRAVIASVRCTFETGSGKVQCLNSLLFTLVQINVLCVCGGVGISSNF